MSDWIGMDLGLYIKLSAMMFLEFAVWGAWYPVLAARLLSTLKFSGKQTGWIYATIPLGCIISPMIAGQIADQWVNTELIIAGAHLVGTLLLFIAAWKRKFGPLFGVMLVYGLFFAATLPLVNALMFRQLAMNNVADASTKSAYIFMWAPIAWALAGYFLTGWRWIFKTGEEGRDCLVLAGVLSVIMAVVSGAFLPETAPARLGEFPLAKALSQLESSSFLIFIMISMLGAGMMQFYFLGTAQFMEENGIPPKNVPASMAVAQAVQAFATLLLLPRLLPAIGFKWTLTLGAASWLLLYVLYTARVPRWLIVVTQAFHGLAYVFFIIVGQIFADSVAPEGAGASMQALIFTAQSGIGLFLGTQFAGIIMDRYRVGGRFQWSRLWAVPGVIMLACVLALILFFQSATA
jgi:MFS family permease